MDGETQLKKNPGFGDLIAFIATKQEVVAAANRNRDTPGGRMIILGSTAAAPLFTRFSNPWAT